MTTIFPADRADAKVLAGKLLELAGPERHDEVRTITDGPLGLAFDVPDDMADAVLGLVPAEGRTVVTDEPAATEAPSPAPPVTDLPPAPSPAEEAPAAATAGESDASADGDERPSRSSRASRARSSRGGSSD